jgi:DNA helicase HerA-like ATPase
MTASILIGSDYWDAQKSGQQRPVLWDEGSVSNHHIGVTGTSGAGKTHWIKKFVSSMPSSVEVDIFDFHGDIDVHGAREVLFSEVTRYGYNPLVLNPDPHYGGVRRCVKDVIEAIASTSRKVGENQEGVLRNLLLDGFALKGIYPDKPATWVKREISEAQARQLFDERKWPELREAYPHLSDVVHLAKRKLKALWMGVDDTGDGQKALSAFDEYSRVMAGINKVHARVAKAQSARDTDELERLQARLEAGKAKAIETHTTFIEAMTTGREFDSALRYNSKEVLLSVINRLENLIALGIFNPNPPPFGNARVRRYNLKPMAQSRDELRMFVNFRLQAIIREMMQRGESDGQLRRLIVIDECKTFLDEDPGSPLNVMVTEMRKFGVGLLLAGQSPAHWSRDFIKTAGTLLLLNLATADWDEAARKLKVDLVTLKYLRPQMTGAVRMLEKGKVPSFRRVQFA